MEGLADSAENPAMSRISSDAPSAQQKFREALKIMGVSLDRLAEDLRLPKSSLQYYVDVKSKYRGAYLPADKPWSEGLRDYMGRKLTAAEIEDLFGPRASSNELREIKDGMQLMNERMARLETLVGRIAEATTQPRS